MKTIDFQTTSVAEFARMLCGVPEQKEAPKEPKLVPTIAYVFGPYRAKCEWEVKRNIENAEAVALQLWRMGHAVICPHKNTAHFGGALGLPDEVWLRGDLALIARCDFLVGVSGWEQSAGSRDEVEFAKSKGIPVYESLASYVASQK